MKERLVLGLITNQPIMANMKSIYFSPRGYLNAKAAIIIFARTENVIGMVAVDWLARHSFRHIDLSSLKRIEYAHFDVSVPDEAYEADILFLSHDTNMR